MVTLAMSKFGTFLALDRADKLASIEAMALVLVAKALVGGVAPRRWRARFGAVGLAAGGSGDLATIRRVRLAMQRAVNNVPGSPNCLPQALAARWMLARRGIAASLFIGSERDEAGESRFHAWLKVGEEWVTGLCDETRYSLLLPGDAEPA